jgi:fructose-1,6-bisphosphatase/inositol monophosphatase family enzyme
MGAMAPALDTDFLLAATRRMHEAIRERTGALLERARRAQQPDLASAPGPWGFGDLSYPLDEEAEDALEDFGREVGARHPLTLIAEGPGMQRYGEEGAGAPLRVLIDPVDGTRSLMHDMRSAWALTGIAPDRGDLTRLSDCVLAVQTELPTTSAGFYHVLWAEKGQGATIARHAVATGEELERRPFVATAGARIDNGYLCFERFLPVERPLVAEIEARFLTRAIEAFDLSPRLLYDDQYLCSAGQLFLVATGRYRMLADLRGWLARTRGIDNFTSKPYDLATLLIWREAGIPVLDDDLAPLDAPLDTETRLSVIAFANDELRHKLQPILRAVMAEE